MICGRLFQLLFTWLDNGCTITGNIYTMYYTLDKTELIIINHFLVKKCTFYICNGLIMLVLGRKYCTCTFIAVLYLMIALHCIASHCIALHCIALHCIALQVYTRLIRSARHYRAYMRRWSIVVSCWLSVYDAGPTWKRAWLSVSYLLGTYTRHGDEQNIWLGMFQYCWRIF